MEGQHQSPFELVSTNISAVLNDVINKLQCRDYSVSIDFARYKIDWLCALLLRVGGNLEDSLLRYLLEAQRMLSIIDVSRYPAVRNFDQFSRNSSFNSPKNIRYLFRNLKRL